MSAWQNVFLALHLFFLFYFCLLLLIFYNVYVWFIWNVLMPSCWLTIGVIYLGSVLFVLLSWVKQKPLQPMLAKGGWLQDSELPSKDCLICFDVEAWRPLMSRSTSWDRLMLYRFHMFTDMPISGFSPHTLCLLMARRWNEKTTLLLHSGVFLFSLQDYVAVEPFFIVNNHRCLPQGSLA